jgi:mono/diheme cytochrome c family protein
MHKTSILIAMLAIFGVHGAAQDDAQYQTWMKSMQPTVGAIRNAADNAAAAADATKLADTFGKVAIFWKAKNADDAVKFAETARDAAKAIAAGSGDKAANLQTIQRTCGGCHSAHRGGAAPNFTIK